MKYHHAASCLILAVTSGCLHLANATFFSHFTSGAGAMGKPLMSMLESSIQKYFAAPQTSNPAPSTSQSPGFLLPATATVGIGTILHGHPPPVKGIPYGAPRPVPPGNLRPYQRTNPQKSSYAKTSYYGSKHKYAHPNNVASHDKETMRWSMQNNAPQNSEMQTYHTDSRYYEDYTRSEILHSSYLASNNDDFQSYNRAPVIVYQGVRPPVRFYQEPRPPIINSNSHHHNLLTSTASSTTHSGQAQLDYSRPDPVFSASQDSEWKPINAVSPMRNYVIMPPYMTRRADAPTKQVTSNSENLRSIDQGKKDSQPSEEVVSAVVFVKQ